MIDRIAQFRQWLGQLERGVNVDFDRGRELAAERRNALYELIEKDPANALSFRVTASQRSMLPPAIVAELETQVDAFGKFEVIAVCGLTTGGTQRFANVGANLYSVYTYGPRVGSISQEKMPMHGIAVGDRLALAAGPYRLPDAGEFNSQSGSGKIQAYVGDGLREFASDEDLQSWANRTTAAERVMPTSFGEHKVLFLKIDFADAPGAAATDQAITASMTEADRYYRDVSDNRTWFTTTTLPVVLRSAKSKAFYNADSDSYRSMMDEAVLLARQFDGTIGNAGTYNPDRYQHVVLLFQNMSGYVSPVAPTGWAGRGQKPGTKVWLNGTAAADVIVHELGHNLGLSHGYAWKPVGTSPIQSGQHVEYGDPFDVMGDSDSTTGSHFSTPKKRALGYISEANVLTASVSGEYRLYRHDRTVGSNIVALKIDAGGAYDYWLEYRRDVDPAFSDYADCVSNGLLMHWNNLPNFTQPGADGTYLLDMTPGSVGDMKDSALVVGQTFADPTYKIRITPLRTGSTVQGDWIDVAISLGDRPSNRAPNVQSVSSNATAFARTASGLVATGTDADGDTVLYQWDMGDGKPVYTTDSRLSYQWSEGGIYPVTVRAFDIYGAETRQTFNITVQDPLDSWDRIFAPGLSEGLRAVCFGRDKFVAVGNYVSASSIDGKSWSKSTAGISDFLGNSIAASATRFVAVGGKYQFSSASFLTGIVSSLDGINWVDVSPNRTEFLEGVAFGSGRFVAVGDKGIIWSSTDGLSWSSVALTSGKDLKEVRFDGSSFLAVGDSGTAVVSTDGVTWEDRSLRDSNTNAAGISWFKDTGGRGLALINGKWIVATGWGWGSPGGRSIFWSSINAKNWTIIPGTYVASYYLLDRLAAIGEKTAALLFKPNKNSEPKIYFSSNGEEWIEKSLGFPGMGSLWSGAEGKGRVVVVGDNGLIFATADGAPALAQQPQSQAVAVGVSVSFQVVAYATGPFTYQWRKNGAAITGATSATLSIPSVTVADGADYTVAVTNGRGFTISTLATLTLNVAPALTSQPASRIASVGSNVVLSAAASGSPTPTFQWLKDGAPIAGATSATLSLSSITKNDAGAYSVRISNVAGNAVSSAANLTITPASVLSNLSIRTTMVSGQTLIVGAVIDGGNKNILLRAAGPALNQYGLLGMADPKIDLYTTGTLPLALNDDWPSSLASTFQSVGAFAFAAGSRDAAMSLPVAGGFTVQARGSGPGTILVEAYDTAGGMLPRLVNLSGRCQVGVGANILIMGFAIRGTGSKQVLIRAIGPGIVGFGVQGALTDPTMKVIDGSGVVVAESDNWNATLGTTFAQVGAFPLSIGSKDAAILVSLNAGQSYTVHVSGVSDSTGEALVEVYEVF